MRKSVNSNIVAANAFITTGERLLSKEEIVKYVDMVRKKTNNKTDSFIGGFDVTTFARNFDFIFTETEDRKDIYVLPEMDNTRLLKGYFRRRLTRSFVKILEETGYEFNKNILEKEEPKQLVKKR